MRALEESTVRFLRERKPQLHGSPGESLVGLVWTRGAAFPITSLENRLKCPLCGSRRVAVIFDLPKEPDAMRIAGMQIR